MFDGVDDALAALDGGRAAEVEAAIGVAATRRLGDPTSRENVARNQRLMTMRRDLPMPALGDLHLPLDAHRLQSALAERALALGRALWPLTGQVPMEVAAQAEAEREAVDLPPRSRAWTPTPTPAPAKAPAPEPADEQAQPLRLIAEGERSAGLSRVDSTLCSADGRPPPPARAPRGATMTTLTTWTRRDPFAQARRPRRAGASRLRPDDGPHPRAPDRLRARRRGAARR
ncbi:hypothetical protein GCM10025868_22290 [Angustibacter aerolatus]|uniref:DUF222 domain-containing protein n=1 Tax=Angustibacter aerolatus TaxID=1162965 RepID=A0ABQ6JHX8_9ACTN|nr:hypothetical protein GCM10025868_22290 [Angustibacter aerolatus]